MSSVNLYLYVTSLSFFFAFSLNSGLIEVNVYLVGLREQLLIYMAFK